MNRWRDVLEWRVGCYICDGDEPDEVKGPCRVGFLCVTTEKAGVPFACTARRDRDRMQHVYLPETNSLVDCMNGLYGFASALGLEDTLADRSTVVYADV
jgi:hypothetical protein